MKILQSDHVIMNSEDENVINQIIKCDNGIILMSIENANMIDKL